MNDQGYPNIGEGSDEQLSLHTTSSSPAQVPCLVFTSEYKLIRNIVYFYSFSLFSAINLIEETLIKTGFKHFAEWH